MKDNICKTLGQNIKKYRKLRNITQEKLAEQIGIEVRTLSLIETGRSFISSKNLEKIAQTLKVNPSNLFENYEANDAERLYKESLRALQLLKNNPAKLKAVNYLINELL